MPPLVLDVDNALLRTDLLHETAVAYVKTAPFRALNLIRWLLQGKAVLKRALSERVPLAVDNLPANELLIDFAGKEHAAGRKVGIATAADEMLARRIARRFDFISFVVASDGRQNLKGACKASVLSKLFPQGFSYAGDSSADLEVWPSAASIVLVGADRDTTAKAKQLGKPIEREFPPEKLGFKGWCKTLRVHQWAKNALVFVPLILSGAAGQPAAVVSALIAFACISLMASGTYLVNDLFDLADDRDHRSKRHRPLASGALRIKHGLKLGLLLIVASFVLAGYLGPATFGVIALYMATTLGYSFHIKRLPIVDAFTLAALFTLRLGLGIVAVGVPASPWLLVFSMFLFTSLAFAKRQTEIQSNVAEGKARVGGRGYVGDDAGMVLALGVATAMSAINIMVLYIMNDVYSAEFYKQPTLLWVFPAALFMWISRVWLLCHRRELHEDPVVFAIRDRISLGLGGLMCGAFLSAWLL